MERYKRLHLWMLLPFAVMQAGIFIDYWGDFSENAWAVHVHYWTATLWYVFLVVQPYDATHGHLARHRTNGIIGFFLAGGVAMTALSALHRDIVSAARTTAEPGIFGPFGGWFFYGIAAVEVVMMSAFILAVVQAIRHRRSLVDHAWWLVSTVFIIMMPALGRGLLILGFVLAGPSEAVIRGGLWATTAIIIGLTLWAARRFGRINHPATWLAVGVNLFNLLFEPIGRSPAIQALLRAAIKG